MGSVTVGAGVVIALGGGWYVLARLAPGVSEAELDEIRSTRGDRVAERFRQMEQERLYTVRVGNVVLPVAVGVFIIALGVDLVR